MLYSREVNYMELNQFVAVTDDPDFCPATTLPLLTLVTHAHAPRFMVWEEERPRKRG